MEDSDLEDVRVVAESEGTEPSKMAGSSFKNSSTSCRTQTLLLQVSHCCFARRYLVTKEKEVGLIWEYVTRYPACEHLLAPLSWDKEKKTYDLLLVVLRSLTTVLLYTCSPHEDAARAKLLKGVGVKVVMTVLSDHMKTLYHCLRTVVPSKLIGACLKLLAAMVMQGTESAKKLQSTFNFAYKPITIFVNKSAPISGESESLRELVMDFALSFLRLGSPEITSTLLEFKGFLSSFLSQLPKDEPKIICQFLTIAHDEVLLNSRVSKKIKSLFFSQFVLRQIAVLLNYPKGCGVSSDDSVDPDWCVQVQELAYRMLKLLACDSKLGILYQPKDKTGGFEKTNNPVLLHLMLFLSNCLQEPVNYNLLLDIASQGVDLLLPFVRSLSFSLEPQPTAKWLREITFLTQVFQDYPSLDGLLDAPEGSQPDVGLVGVAVAFTVPPIVTRLHYNQGLQHSVPLVQYSTVKLMNVVLARTLPVLTKWGPIRKNCQTISSFLVRYADMVLKNLPDVRTLVSLWRSLGGKKKPVVLQNDGSATEELLAEDRLRNADLEDGDLLQAEVSKALSGYQKLSPNIFLQINFNPAKLLPSISRCSSGHAPCRRQVLDATLELLENSCSVGMALTTEEMTNLLWLLVGADESRTTCTRCIKRIVERHFPSAGCGMDLFLSSFLDCCLPLSDSTAELAGGVAAILSELLVDSHYKEKAAVEAVRDSSSDRGETLTLEQVLSLPDSEVFDILDDSSDLKGQRNDADEDMPEESDYFMGEKFLYTLVAGIATACDNKRNATLCSFLSSLVLRCHFDSRYAATPSRDAAFRIVLSCSPSLTLFIIHHVLEASRGGGSGVAGTGSLSEEVQEVESREIIKSVMRHSCAILVRMTSDQRDRLHLMSYLEPKHWNQLVYIILKDYLGCSDALHFLSLFLPFVYGVSNTSGDGDEEMEEDEEEAIRPLVVLYEMIWSHSEFLNVMASVGRACLVELLVSIAELEPLVCQGNAAHHTVFLGAYSATRSLADRGLLYLMFLYEQHGVSVGGLSPFYWGSAALEQHRLQQQSGDKFWRSEDNSDQVLHQLDTPTLLKSSSNFSSTQPLQPTNPFSKSEEHVVETTQGKDSLYDLSFLLPLFSHSLEKGMTVDCRRFVWAGCLSFAIVCLSSLQYSVREAASHILSRFKVHLEASKFREKAQISLLCEVLQNTILDLNAFLPSVHTSLMARASRLFLQADHPVYFVVSNFMVYKPSLNLREIPLLTTMLHSSSSHAVVEREWLLKVLVDGLRCDKDLVLYKKHKVLSHLTVLADSGLLSQRAKEFLSSSSLKLSLHQSTHSQM